MTIWLPSDWSIPLPAFLVRVSHRGRRPVRQHLVGGPVRPDAIADESQEDEPGDRLEALTQPTTSTWSTSEQLSPRLHLGVEAAAHHLAELEHALVGERVVDEQSFLAASHEAQCMQ